MLTTFHCLILAGCLLAPGWLWAQDESGAVQGESGAVQGESGAVQGESGAVQDGSDAVQGQSGAVQSSPAALLDEEAIDEGRTVVTPASVQRRPVWEFGVGGGYFSGFDYPASQDANQRLLALPFFIYRTPQFRFGDGGVRAVAIERPKLKLDLALAASLNSSSEGNSVREGMEDLNFLFEIGPQLEVSLIDRAMPSGGRVQMRLNAEVRGVMETDFKRINNRGVVAELGFGITYRNFKRSGIDLLGSISSSYGNEKLQDYFYEVDPEFVTDTRPAFDAKGGYLETRVFGGLGFRLRKNVRIFLGTFTGLYDGARNQDSPLFETTSSTGYAIGVVWTIKTSRRYVDIVEMGADR